MLNERFEKQLHFLVEIDKMKTVMRQTMLIDRSRQENDAEHSWHFAVMAMILQEYAAPANIDIAHVIKLALVHDLIEVYAGDTFAYDDASIASKATRENEAADKLFALLPSDQGDQIRALWTEFDEMKTPEAGYANAIDRLQPLINNHYTEGHTWRKGHVPVAKVYKRMEPIKTAAPALWPFVEFVIADALEKGFIQK